jgi:hypothetical protein
MGVEPGDSAQNVRGKMGGEDQSPVTMETDGTFIGLLENLIWGEKM